MTVKVRIEKTMVSSSDWMRWRCFWLGLSLVKKGKVTVSKGVVRKKTILPKVTAAE